MHADAHDAAMVSEWAEELSAAVGRPAAAVRGDGLKAGDFPAEYSLCLAFPDGSKAEFAYAVHAFREQTGELAVFTEHCGCHVFPAAGVTLTRVRREWIDLGSAGE